MYVYTYLANKADSDSEIEFVHLGVKLVAIDGPHPTYSSWALNIVWRSLM